MKMSTSIPSTFKAWQYSSAKGGIESNLKINPSVSVPKPKPNQHIIQVIAVALNPVDYKPAENPIINRLAIPKNATPGIDIAGRIIQAATDSNLKPGSLVFGTASSNPLAAGGLSEYITAPSATILPILDGIDPIDAACLPVAGLTAYQSIKPYVKSDSRIFINGGSGGVGVLGIQIAKTLGCHVTTTCSTPNVELCKSLGADEVIDYTKTDVLQALKERKIKFDHVVDNVGKDFDLYWKSHEYTNPNVTYVMIAGDPSLAHLLKSQKAKNLPAFLGGGQRKFSGFWPSPKLEDLEELLTLLKQGKLKPVIDSTWSFEDVPKAFEKLKTGRAKGKIIVKVESQ
jgi:NADPH:quinone reductase-like Zn-dependent oxidoreductase